MKRKRGIRLWWLILPLIGLDRLLKLAMRAALAPAGVRTVIPGVLSWAYTQNTGAAFSLLAGHGAWLLIALTALLIAAVLLWLARRPDEPRLQRVGLWLIVGGGLGNLWDRLAYGYVIDFIRLDFVHFAVFNLADVFVCVGAGLAALSLLLNEGRAPNG